MLVQNRVSGKFRAGYHVPQQETQEMLLEKFKLKSAECPDTTYRDLTNGMSVLQTWTEL
jgi:hypothetical protein